MKKFIQKTLKWFATIYKKNWWTLRFERRLNKFIQEEVTDDMADELAEEFLKALLRSMSLQFKLDAKYHENIESFKAKIQFSSKNARKRSWWQRLFWWKHGSIAVLAIFDGKNMKVKELRDHIPDKDLAAEKVDVSVQFKNGKALINYLYNMLRSEKSDILRLVMNHEVVVRGNPNYLFKFGYMANHAQQLFFG